MVTEPTSSHTTRVERFSFAAFDEKPASTPFPAAKAKPVEKPAPQPSAPPPPVVVTENDVEAARDEGYKRGYAEGTTATEEKVGKETAAREDAVRGLLEVIANRITIAAETHTAELKQQEEVAGKLVMAISRKLAGDALRREPQAGVESLLRECLGMIIGSPRVVITVARIRAEGLKQRIDVLKSLLPGFEGELAIETDADFGEQDCRVEWKGGMGERRQDTLWREIEDIIAQKTLNT